MTKEIGNDQMTKDLPERSFHYSGFAILSSFACHAVAWRRQVIRTSSFLLLLVGFATAAPGQTITRADALHIVESYIQHRWQSSPKNLLHGKDRRGVEVHTPDHEGGRGSPLDECWRVNDENVGVAYKWGGDDTLASFDLGIRSGKAAGDVYTPEKRRLDDAAVSDAAVGIDCSGFICRCWKTTKRYSTSSLADICRKLPAVSAIEPADIMDQPHGHVLMFVKWL
ncbi:MAG TPA: hypothetical protein VGM62_05775, partial [Chthoniobacterales bacterium]